MLYFQDRESLPYWYDIATPSFFYHQMAQGKVDPCELNNLTMMRSDLTKFKSEAFHLTCLLFQSCYLAMTGEAVEDEKPFYTPDYPNREVRTSLNQQLLMVVSTQIETEVFNQSKTLTRRLTENDFTGLERELKAFFVGIPPA